MDFSKESLESIAQRLTTIEQRLTALEHRPSTGTTRTVKKQEHPTGVRATRRPAIWIGILLLFFGWTIFEGIGTLIGLSLILYGIIVGLVTKPVYTVTEVPLPPHVPTPPGATGAAPVKPASASLEVDIGKRIFAWVGIVTLLIGLTFFVTYSFQNFDNVGKIIVGYGVSLALFLAGRRLRLPARPFSYVLEGGAWALAYFMTYATSFVPEFNILNNPTLTFILLMVIIAAMTVVSLAERAPVFTAGAFLLGYGTALVGSDTGTLSLWAVLMLSLGALFVSLRLNWYAFGIGGAIGTYLTFFRWIGSLPASDLSAADETSGIGFLILYALIFGIGHILAKPQTAEQRMYIRIGVAVNIFLSFIASLTLFDRAGAELWVVAAVYGAVLAAFAGASTLLSRARWLGLPYVLLSIAAITTAVALKFTNETLIYVWVIEAAVLVVMGIFTRTWPIRLMGYILSLLSGLLILGDLMDSNSTTASLVAITLTTVALWLALGAWLANQRDSLRAEEHQMSYVFTDAAIALGVVLVQSEVTEKMVSVATGMIGLAILVAGFAAKSKNLRGVSIAILGFTIFRVFLVDVALLDAFGKMISFIVLGAILLGVAYLYSRSRSQTQNPPPPGAPTT